MTIQLSTPLAIRQIYALSAIGRLDTTAERHAITKYEEAALRELAPIALGTIATRLAGYTTDFNPEDTSIEFSQLPADTDIPALTRALQQLFALQLAACVLPMPEPSIAAVRLILAGPVCPLIL